MRDTVTEGTIILQAYRKIRPKIKLDREDMLETVGNTSVDVNDFK